jgi:hypothetical protein
MYTGYSHTLDTFVNLWLLCNVSFVAKLSVAGSAYNALATIVSFVQMGAFTLEGTHSKPSSHQRALSMQLALSTMV